MTWHPRLRDASISRARVVLLDARGQVLGRLASVAAAHLRGKAWGPFSPSTDQGARVLVVNAAHVRVTGRKEDQKTYFRNVTQRPGGGKTESLRLLRARAPERIVQRAVWGMLPKGRLGRELFRKLRVFAGDEYEVPEWSVARNVRKNGTSEEPTSGGLTNGTTAAATDASTAPAAPPSDVPAFTAATVRLEPPPPSPSPGRSRAAPHPEVLDVTGQVSTSAGPHCRPAGTDARLPATVRREALWRETERRLRDAESKLTRAAWERDGAGWKGGVPGVLALTRGRGPRKGTSKEKKEAKVRDAKNVENRAATMSKGAAETSRKNENARAED